MDPIINTSLKDAFSSGQISSKIWLCEQLERTRWKPKSISIYGGWYGITAFLLLSRNNLKVKQIHSYDIDPSCELIADLINENWVWQNWKFKAYTYDCNNILTDADLIINTSTEHFDSKEWFENIRPGTKVAIQGNNMKHDDHVIYTKNLQQFLNQYPLRNVKYQGQLDFKYPDKQFTRFMQIGIK